MTTYQRPNISKADKDKAIAMAMKMTSASVQMTHVRLMIISLIVENMQMTTEVQAHRATLGIDPLPEFKLPE